MLTSLVVIVLMYPTKLLRGSSGSSGRSWRSSGRARLRLRACRLGYSSSGDRTRGGEGLATRCDTGERMGRSCGDVSRGAMRQRFSKPDGGSGGVEAVSGDSSLKESYSGSENVFFGRIGVLPAVVKPCSSGWE